MIVVEKEMSWLNDIFKLLISPHGEYVAILSEEEQMENDNWFDLADEDLLSRGK